MVPDAYVITSVRTGRRRADELREFIPEVSPPHARPDTEMKRFRGDRKHLSL